MSLSENAREQIDCYLMAQLRKFVKDSLSETGEKPFHTRLLPQLSTGRFSERSFSTRSGAWFQKIALIVARDHNPCAESNYSVKGNLQPAADAHITAVLEQMDKGRPKRIPNRERDLQEVLTVQSPGGARRELISDLFVEKATGEELYFEMKTPGPNKGQCKAMKRDILLISALRKGHRASAYAAAAYNPYGEGSEYRHNYARQFLEVGRDMLIGRSFWEKIGDKTTYDELLEIATVVGAKISKEIS